MNHQRLSQELIIIIIFKFCLKVQNNTSITRKKHNKKAKFLRRNLLSRLTNEKEVPVQALAHSIVRICIKCMLRLNVSSIAITLHLRKEILETLNLNFKGEVLIAIGNSFHNFAPKY